MASEILAMIAETEAKCEEMLKGQHNLTLQAAELAEKNAEEKYNAIMEAAKEAAAARLRQAEEYAQVIKGEKAKKTQEEITEMKKQCAAKESPVVLALSKKIIELS